METGLLSMIAAVLGGGLAGGLLTTWSIHRRQLRTEDRLNELERITVREVKRYAAKERWNKTDHDAEQLAAQLTSKRPAELFDNEFIR